LTVFFTEVVDGHDARMSSHPAHRLCFPKYPLAPNIIEAICFYQSERDVPVQDGISGEVHHLLAALSE